jgi:hypothetical protein
MQPDEKPEFARILNGLAAIKPGGKITRESLDVWWLSLADWPLAEFRAAAAHLARSVEFMPSPFHFEQLRKAGRPTAGEAWARAVASARRGGGTDDPLIERAIAAMGGWIVVRMSDEDKLHFLERRFSEHYESIQDADDTREAVPSLASMPMRPKLTGPVRLNAALPPRGDA